MTNSVSDNREVFTVEADFKLDLKEDWKLRRWEKGHFQQRKQQVQKQGFIKGPEMLVRDEVSLE